MNSNSSVVNMYGGLIKLGFQKEVDRLSLDWSVHTKLQHCLTFKQIKMSVNDALGAYLWGDRGGIQTTFIGMAEILPKSICSTNRNSKNYLLS